MNGKFIAQRVAEGSCEPLGIPALFLAGQLARGEPATRVLNRVRSVLSEYAGAEGYGAAWGQIVEQTFGRRVAWRFVPVAWWEGIHSARQQSAFSIPELINIAQPDAIGSIAGRLAEGVVSSGTHPDGRRHPHSLLTLVLVAPARELAVRHWIGAVFLPCLLPQALAQAERRLREVLDKRQRGAANLAQKAK